MKKAIKILLVVALVSVGVFAPLLTGDVASAVNPVQDACNNSGSASTLCQTTNGSSVGSVVKLVVNVLLFVVGLISVIMIIVGGIRFSTSGGNAGSVTSAKNTILYAVLGLVISFLAYAIVNWVIDLL